MAKFRELKFRNFAVSKPQEFELKFRVRENFKFYGVKLRSGILEF